MKPTARHSQCGLTLLELMLAVGIFTFLVGATAQSLVAYRVTLSVQEQRNAALQECRALLNDIRATRDANRLDFPDAILEQWADGAETLMESVPNGVLTVDYVDPGSNPLQVSVTARWSDMRGHPVAVALSTMLTDR